MPPTRDYSIADPVNSPVDLDDGTLCRARSPQVGIVGSFPSAVGSWDLEAKLLEAARRTTPKLPAEARAEFAALLTGTNLAIFAGVLVAWAGSHFFGVGEIVDVILLVVGAFTIGWQIGQVARDLWSFVDIARNAKTYDDLDRAADHLARVVVTIGITVFTALIMKAASRLRIRVKRGSSSNSSKTGQARNSSGSTNKSASEGGAASPPKSPRNLDKPGLDKWLGENRGELANDPARRASHLEGTDFSKPVVQKELPTGTKIIQYERVGGRPGNYAGYEGATPNELGIDGGGRVLKTYEVTKPLEVVESTAAPFDAGKVAGVGGKGGAQQLSLPDGWMNSVKPSP